MRSLDGQRFILKVVQVADVSQARELAAQQMAVCGGIESRHLVRLHNALAVADGTLVLVLDEVSGGSLAHLLGVRGQLTAGETVTTVAPLFRALADLHAAGIVHGDLAPGNVLFNADGRPLIGELGLSRLLGRPADRLDGTVTGGSVTGGSVIGGRLIGGSLIGGSLIGSAVTGGFDAPEICEGAAPSPASDVYSMAALGWFCLTGAAPEPVASRSSLTAIRPEIPVPLAEVLTSCLSIDPAARPSAGSAALMVFDAATPESVALAGVSDPAGEVTRRIRAAAASGPDPEPSGIGRKLRTPLVLGLVASSAVMAVMAVIAVTVLGFGAVRPGSRPDVGLEPVAVGTAAPTSGRLLVPARTPAPARMPPARTPETTTSQTRAPQTRTPETRTSRRSTVSAATSDLPRVDASGLLQSLVDARALAYVARNAALLDLVYAPGAKRAEVDRDSIATAVKNGGTYLGLSFVIKDVAFLGGTIDTARIRATIVTPAYSTGQPDGRKIPHVKEILAPCTFSLRRFPDGWRILSLATP